VQSADQVGSVPVHDGCVVEELPTVGLQDPGICGKQFIDICCVQRLSELDMKGRRGVNDDTVMFKKFWSADFRSYAEKETIVLTSQPSHQRCS
jgi:hypothetical protein